MTAIRPQFKPLRCNEIPAEWPQLTAESPQATDEWIPVVGCPADFPLELFEIAVAQLIHHPEYNSTLILRSETLSDLNSDFPSLLPRLKDLVVARSIRRKLLPRRPGRDAALEQWCTFYRPFIDTHLPPVAMVLSPIAPPGSSLPYYHPEVSHLAFRYINAATPLLRIEVVPLPSISLDQGSRLYRTCLALLDALHRYGWGAVSSYKKRVMHDCIVPRDTYQDLYLVMRERHKHLVDSWHEVTDPLKHVFEDIGIATFLMLLWKDTFDVDTSRNSTEHVQERPWNSWPRPPGGFLDLGCGNGLLTHILTSEGYSGHGIDVRARTSWQHYPETTQAQLHVHAFDPTDPVSVDGAFFRPGAFIIGNHSDELTPWIPVLSTLHDACGYLSIPCCAWDFDVKFERAGTHKYPIPSEEWVDALNLGGEGSKSSSYSIYRIWLASLSLHCGWEVECETLRIPSTRNWAIIGRKRVVKDGEEAAREIVDRVRLRGIFKTRKPEGKHSEH